VSGFCDRCVTAGLPLARSLLFIDTLHPIHEGRLFRWGYSSAETPLLEYGRTSPDALAATGFNPRDVEIAERWRRSPHYRMLQTGESFWRRRLNAATEDEFSVLAEWRAEGMTDYVAIIRKNVRAQSAQATWPNFAAWHRGDRHGCARRRCSLGGHKLVVAGGTSRAALTTRRFPPPWCGATLMSNSAPSGGVDLQHQLVGDIHVRHFTLALCDLQIGQPPAP
jgi:hypothetical protein